MFSRLSPKHVYLCTIFGTLTLCCQKKLFQESKKHVCGVERTWREIWLSKYFLRKVCFIMLKKRENLFLAPYIFNELIESRKRLIKAKSAMQ